MSQELERVHTINLGKVLLSVNTHRATRAINMIKEYARRHMKTEDIKIEEDLAHQIWARGARHPPRKIRVRMSKTDEGYVLISRFDEDAETEITPPKEKKKGKEKGLSKPEKPSKEPELKEPELKEPKAAKPAKEAKQKEPEKEGKKKSSKKD